MNDPATSTIRVVVDLKVKSGYSLIEDGSKGQVVVQLKNAKYKVVLDAGHGDQDPGAISISGKQEKDFNLTMVLKVKKILDQNPNIQVYLTRSDDTFVTLDGRCEFANNLGANVFVSIHGNKWVPSTSGSETYYWRPESLSLANIMHKNLVAAAGLPDRQVRQNDFRVVKYTNMPAVLLEVGYLSSPNDEPQMFNAAFQDRVAGGIANGIKQYLNLN
ncbi:N-acetylmuramoyl-L-alanine amidase [Paenibacillus sp. CC-CFT747]|nr:N-acetylmuramoyl-L-alanine amidase [Paenibacillus sp. CC-CFT747]